MLPFLTKPLKAPPLLDEAYHIGRFVLRWDAIVPGQPITHQVAQAGWLHWLIAQGGPATMVGLLIIAIVRSEEHTSELQSLMRISYAVFCLKKKTTTYTH